MCCTPDPISTVTMARAPPPAPSTRAPCGHLSSDAPIRATQPGAHPVDVGVVAAQLVALADDDIDRARSPRVIREPVDQGGDLLLVRRLDQSAGDVVGASCAMTSGRRCGRFSQRSMASGNPAAAMAACCTASKAVWVED